MNNTSRVSAAPATFPDNQPAALDDVVPEHGGGSDGPPPEAVFESCLGLIDGISQTVARRGRLSPQDAEDFASMARLRLIENDYAILRKFKGRSSLKTYLTVVIHRLLIDEQVAQWGKWRPSRQTLQQGPIALLLDRLTRRDGLSFDEACVALETNHGVRLRRSVVARMYAKLPARAGRRFTTDEPLAEIPDPSSSPEEGMVRSERVDMTLRARNALVAAIALLTPEDRHLLQLRFCRGCSVADVARSMRLKQKALYGRFERVLSSLRDHLTAAGVNGPELLNALGHGDIDVSDAAPFLGAD